MRQKHRAAITKTVVFLAILSLGLLMGHACYAAEVGRMTEKESFDHRQAFTQAEREAEIAISELGDKYRGIMQKAYDDIVSSVVDKYHEKLAVVVREHGWQQDTPEQEVAFHSDWGAVMIPYHMEYEAAVSTYEQTLVKIEEDYKADRHGVHVQFWTRVGEIQDKLSGKIGKKDKLSKISGVVNSRYQNLRDRQSIDRRIPGRASSGSGCGGRPPCK